MTSNLYQTLSQQAWKQYQSVTGRPEKEVKQMQTAYTSFEDAAKKLDAAVVFSSPPTKEQLAAASNAVTVLESAFNGIDSIAKKLAQSDRDAVKNTGTVSQGQKADSVKREQQNDSDLEQALGNALYQGQLQVAAALASSPQ